MKLTPSKIDGIIEMVKTTKLPIIRISAFAGVTRGTLERWLRNGENNQKKLEAGDVSKSDLSLLQKREMELFLRVEMTLAEKEEKYLKQIEDFSAEKGDIKGYQFLLKRLHKTYDDNRVEEIETKNTQNILVVNLFDGEAPKLLTDFMAGIGTNAEEIEHTEVS